MSQDISNKKELEEKAIKINEIYKSSLLKINELGNKAISLLKDIQKKREQKKVQDLTKELTD